MGPPNLPPPPLLDPAWYPDPTGRYEARYWDGRKWTSHISHYGATGADPLLRARWDNVWVRGLGRLLLWAALVGVGYWAFLNYWPRDDRDLAAEQELVDSAVSIMSDLPQSEVWSPGEAVIVSPLKLQFANDGEVQLAACVDFAEEATNAKDQPRMSSQFVNERGSQTMGNALVIGKDSGFASRYLDQLTAEGTRFCLEALWVQLLGGTGIVVTSVDAMNPPSFGDSSVWWRLSALDKRSTTESQIFTDFVAVRSGRVVSEFTFSGSPAGVGVDIQRSVIANSSARIISLLEAFGSKETQDDGAEADKIGINAASGEGA